MMEIKIVITKQNKEEVLKLIDQLVEWEAKGIAEEKVDKAIIEQTRVIPSVNFLKDIPKIDDSEVADAEIEKRAFGTWGMFNSYIPGKTAIRVLMNLMKKKDGTLVKFSDVIDECIAYSSRFGLYKFRGFPKRTSESARGRLAAHLISPYHDMGLIKITGSKKDRQVSATKDGIEFAKLPNPLIDGVDKKKFLSEEEREWLISHLKRIDKLGFKEFSVLNGLTKFLAEKRRRFADIVNWFKDNQSFVDWVRTGSRYRDDPKAFSRQLDNVARTFASGKVALLRELGILSTARATYQVLQNLEGDEYTD